MRHIWELDKTDLIQINDKNIPIPTLDRLAKFIHVIASKHDRLFWKKII